MKKLSIIVFIVVALAFVIACGGDDDDPPADSASVSVTPPVSAEQQDLRDKLASILLRPSDLPPGLELSGPIFSTNEQVAGPNQDELQRLIELGRQLGVDSQYIPTDALDPAEPARGGVQSSASVYVAPAGASATFQETAGQARANDWAANYPNLDEVKAEELDKRIGDESLWLRISGLQGCTPLATNTPAPDGAVPSATCEGVRRVVIDNVIFRVGRVRAYVQVSSLFPEAAEPDVYTGIVGAWADIVAQRAAETFPTS